MTGLVFAAPTLQGLWITISIQKAKLIFIVANCIQKVKEGGKEIREGK